VLQALMLQLIGLMGHVVFYNCSLNSGYESGWTSYSTVKLSLPVTTLSSKNSLPVTFTVPLVSTAVPRKYIFFNFEK